MLHDTDFHQQPEWECVREIAEDIISNPHSNANEHQNVGLFYDAAEAHSILPTNNLLFEEYEVSGERISQGEMCMGIYTCSLYIFTIVIFNDTLFVIDTHPVNKKSLGEMVMVF